MENFTTHISWKKAKPTTDSHSHIADKMNRNEKNEIYYTRIFIVLKKVYLYINLYLKKWDEINTAI